MKLNDVLNLSMQEAMKAANLTEMEMGTVTSVKPLEVRINGSMPPLRAPVLLLSECVVQKKIPVLQHTHAGVHGQTGPALLKDDIFCREHEKDLPVRADPLNGREYIILNEALQVGDRVILMKVARGQRYIIISRVFEVDGIGDNPSK